MLGFIAAAFGADRLPSVHSAGHPFRWIVANHASGLAGNSACNESVRLFKFSGGRRFRRFPADLSSAANCEAREPSLAEHREVIQWRTRGWPGSVPRKACTGHGQWSGFGNHRLL